ncbi:MAG: Wzz/FepE/Etk N-terminal domain-containing protein [Gaiellaceae bacterium]
MIVRDESSFREVLTNPPKTLAEYLAIVRRRKWFIIAVPLLTALTAFSLSQTQTPVYKADAQILVSRAGIVTAIANVQDPATYDATRYLTTQSTIARSPELAARVVAAAKVPDVTPGLLLGISAVAARTDADLLDFSVSYSDPNDAVLLVNAYARQFVRYKTALDTAKVNDALRVIRAQLATLQAQDRTNSPAYDTLIQYKGQLETIGKLQADNTSVLRVAEGAGQISPRPKQNVLLGALIGLVLGFGLAILLEALDRRVRSGEEVEAILGLPLLGRVSPPPRWMGKKDTLVMLSEPMSPGAETFRKLRTTIEFASRDRGARTFMFTSSVQREGKSTTVANLAVAFARAGRRVALVDLDLRRPSLHSFFDVRTEHGIADVIVNDEKVAQVLQQVTLPPANPSAVAALGNGRAPRSRWASPGPAFASASLGSTERPEDLDTFHFLASGRVHADGEFFQSERVSAVLQELGEVFDIVLVDAPPFLAVGDAMSLTASVDAIVVVTRLETQHPVLRELARELRNCEAPALGFILTGVPPRHGLGYGYGYGYGYSMNRDRQGPITHDMEDEITSFPQPLSPGQPWGDVARGRP